MIGKNLLTNSMSSDYENAELGYYCDSRSFSHCFDVLVHLGCYKKIPWTEVFKEHKHISHSLEDESLRSECQHGQGSTHGPFPVCRLSVFSCILIW